MIEMTGYIFDENDDLAAVMDSILNRIRCGAANNADDDEEWIGRTGCRNMEGALKHMMPKEREMIKRFFYQEKNILDISIEMNMELNLIGGYIGSAKEQMAIWV